LMTVTAQLRYSFTAQFIRGSAIFATHAHKIESDGVAAVSEDVQAEHRSYIVSAVVQCAAALEAEISEVARHGPGHHLGSNGLDAAAHTFLQPLVDVIDDQPTLHRYELILHLLRRPAIDRGAYPYQSADLLIKLRNELIHYKSKWGPEMEREKLFARLQKLRLEKPPFMSPNTNFFPHQCLSASLGSWCVTAAVTFINDFYAKLGVASPLKPHEAHLVVPSPRITVAA
jgi:hypothetical protein